jgi:hypothetical protein
MKKKRYIASTAVIAACACFVLGALTMLPPRPGVTKGNFDRIKHGMTKAEVESLFGPPPMAPIVSSTKPGKGLIEHWLWRGRDGEAEIVFVNGAVDEKIWDDIPRNWTEKIRHWVRLD